MFISKILYFVGKLPTIEEAPVGYSCCSNCVNFVYLLVLCYCREVCISVEGSFEYI